MKLSERQKKIVEIVKNTSHSAVRKSLNYSIFLGDLALGPVFSDLGWDLKATPKVGYTYSGSDLETLFFSIPFEGSGRDYDFACFRYLMIPLIKMPLLPLFKCMMRMFSMSLMSIKLLLGILSRKDLLRASLQY